VEIMEHTGRALRHALYGLVLLAPVPASVSAQAPPAPRAGTPAPSPQVAVPDAERIVLLLRATLLTLNDAVQSGNFTVLRDVAAPSFRDANSAARLGASFNDLSQRGIDLSPVAILAPQLTDAPAIDPQTGMLRIKGTFPGQPVRINFDVIYQPVAGRWRLFGLSVQPVAAASEAAAPPPAAETGAAKFAPKTAPAIKKVDPLKK